MRASIAIGPFGSTSAEIREWMRRRGEHRRRTVSSLELRDNFFLKLLECLRDSVGIRAR
jgi:hypothetical protein